MYAGVERGTYVTICMKVQVKQPLKCGKGGNLGQFCVTTLRTGPGTAMVAVS